MAEEPDRLRQGIENTRASLTRDVDLLAEKTSPTKAAQRRWATVKEKVMGSSEHIRSATGGAASAAADTVQDKVGTVRDKVSEAGGDAGDKVHDAADAVRRAPQAVATRAQGNPLAAGVIAFGVGMLAATLIPVTDAERRTAQELKDRSDGLTHRVKDIAGDLQSDLSSTVQEAAAEVRDTARDAAQTTGQQARSAVQDATRQTRQKAGNAS
jgi:gas vesicle protein